REMEIDIVPGRQPGRVANRIAGPLELLGAPLLDPVELGVQAELSFRRSHTYRFGGQRILVVTFPGGSHQTEVQLATLSRYRHARHGSSVAPDRSDAAKRATRLWTTPASSSSHIDQRISCYLHPPRRALRRPDMTRSIEGEVKNPHWLSRAGLVWLLAALGLALAVTPVFAGSTISKSSERKLTEAANGNFEVLEAADQYAEARTAPADAIDPDAFSGAYAAANNLPLAPGAWSELTTKPYDSDAHGYRDPVWSNSGGGSQVVAGRMTALAVDGATLYAGAADGGVWQRSGGNWTALTDDAPTLSVGALAVDSAHGLWVGTGEANTSSDSYAGIGVLYKAAGSSTF